MIICQTKYSTTLNIEKFGTKILIDTNDKMPDDITLNIKNVVILMTCAVKDDSKFYQEIFLEKALFVK